MRFSGISTMPNNTSEATPFETCFLQDGDSFVMGTKDLIAVLRALKKAFPSLRRISSYGRAQTMAKKSPAAIKDIHDAGLNKLYCGMESGSQKVLKQVKKGITPESIIKSGVMGREAGMEITEFIILGLGGQALSRDHAMETARVLNAVNPDQIRLLTIGVRPGSALEAQMKTGEFTLMSESDIIAEQRLMLEQLTGITSHYANHHAIDLLLEVRGQLPGDKEQLLAILDSFLDLEVEERHLFTLGRRLGYFQRLSDLDNSLSRDFVKKTDAPGQRKRTGSGNPFPRPSLPGNLGNRDRKARPAAEPSLLQRNLPLFHILPHRGPAAVDAAGHLSLVPMARLQQADQFLPGDLPVPGRRG